MYSSHVPKPPTLITFIIPNLTTNDISYSLLAVPFNSTDVSNSNYTIFNSSNGSGGLTVLRDVKGVHDLGTIVVQNR